MEEAQSFVIAILIGAFWFVSAYFAVSFMPFPLSEYALNCAFFNFGLSLLAYAFLKVKGWHKEGFLLGLVLLFPIVYLTIGLIWLIFRPIFDLIVK